MPREAVSDENLVDSSMKKSVELDAEQEDSSSEFSFDDVEEPDIAVVDDTPKEDRDKPERKGEPLDEEEVKSEAKDFSKRAQERINQLVYERHEERRRKEALEREFNAAANLIKQQNERIKKFQSQLKDGESMLLANAKSRVEAQIAAAKELYKQAVEDGDAEAMVAANAQLARASAESLGIEQYKPQYQEVAEAIQEQQAHQEQQAQQQARPQPEAPQQPDQKAVEWASKNTWFGRDRLMTSYAQALHEQLVLIDGVDPRSEDYWQKVDSGMKERFPEKFQSNNDVGSKRDPVKDAVVAPSQRTRERKKRVTLTESEIRLAKKLGVSREDYAKQKLMLENR